MDYENTTRKAIRLPSVCEATGLSPRQIYRLVKADKFPRPRKPSARVSLWFTDELQAWMDSLPVATFIEESMESNDG